MKDKDSMQAKLPYSSQLLIHYWRKRKKDTTKLDQFVCGVTDKDKNSQTRT